MRISDKVKPGENWCLFQGPQEMWLRDERVNPFPLRSCYPSHLGRPSWSMALPGTSDKHGWCQSGAKAMWPLGWWFSNVWGASIKCCIVQMYRTSSLLWNNFGQGSHCWKGFTSNWSDRSCLGPGLVYVCWLNSQNHTEYLDLQRIPQGSLNLTLKGMGHMGTKSTTLALLHHAINKMIVNFLEFRPLVDRERVQSAASYYSFIDGTW